MGETREIGKEAFPFFIGRFSSHAINFIIIIFMARLLGPVDYGIFSLGITLLMLFYTLSVIGVDVSTPYFVSRAIAEKDYDKARSVYNQAFRMRIIAALIMSLILYLLSDWLSAVYNLPSLSFVSKIFSIGTFAYSIIYFFTTAYQGFKKLKYSMFQDLFFTVSRFIILPLILIAGLIGAVYGQVISTILTLCLGLIFIYKKVLPKNPHKEVNMYSKLIKYSLISYLGFIIAYFSGYIGSIIMGSYPEQVAYLTLSQRIGLFIGLPAASLSIALFPSISSKLDKSKINNIFSLTTKYTILLSCFLSFLVISITREAIIFFLTSTYMPGLATIQLMTAGEFLLSATVSFDALFLGINKPGLATKGKLVQGVCSILLTALLVIPYQSIGVGLAFVISNIIYLSYLLIISRKLKANYPLSYLLRMIACGLIASMVVFINFERSIISLLVKTTGFLGLFLLAGYLLNVIRKNEYLLVKKTFLYIGRLGKRKT